eukprot:gb/GFBE01055284.1/.p1 GENE.gb/GFBE01055284.1/~~gb/GFBE01055284.1/.p1  ORF type:complete len:415 (+),score=54.29 gb/GFBE01055284.1/:1-1245(+)
MEASPTLLALFSSLQAGEHDEAIRVVQRRAKTIAWERLPERIVLLRHGQSEGNVDHMLYTSKGDSQLELTEVGVHQAMEAGARLLQLLPEGGRVCACISPFERTYQTLLGIFRGGFPSCDLVHVDPQIREQEFGNFQDPGLTSKVRAEEKRVGRFYYRRPNAESSADVFDRVTAFWERLLCENTNGLLLGQSYDFDMCLVVTHGLTIRLMLMCLFQWSVETFETVWNVGNCHHVTLKKNMHELKYELCIEESYPPRLPWGTREVWIVLKALSPPEALSTRLDALIEVKKSMQDSDGHASEIHQIDKLIGELQNKMLLERSQPYTIVDYIGIPQPRTMHTAEVLNRLLPGHNLQGQPEELALMAKEGPKVSMEDIELIDWWGPARSYRGKMLRVSPDGCWSVHGSPKKHNGQEEG